MKKQFTFLFVLALTCIVLTSCVQNDVGIAVDKDGGGTIEYSYQISKLIVDEFLGSKPPGSLANASIEIVDGEAYYCGSVHAEAKTKEELREQLLSLSLFNEAGAPMFSEAALEESCLKLTTSSEMIPSDISALSGENLYQYLTLELKVTMPGEITSVTKGTLSTDKRTVSISLDKLENAQTVEIQCEKLVSSPRASPQSKAPLIIGVALLALLAIGVIAAAIVLLIKRKRAEQMPDQPIDPN